MIAGRSTARAIATPSTRNRHTPPVRFRTPRCAAERMKIIRAAGGIVWRASPDGPRLAVIHRPRRDDWTLPKGKLEPGETWEEAALREVLEETGCLAHIASFAGSSFYTSRRGPKLVLYWHMILTGEGPLPDGSEVDGVAWLSPSDALRCVERERERRILACASLAARAVGTALRAPARQRPLRSATARSSRPLFRWMRRSRVRVLCDDLVTSRAGTRLAQPPPRRSRP